MQPVLRVSPDPIPVPILTKTMCSTSRIWTSAHPESTHSGAAKDGAPVRQSRTCTSDDSTARFTYFTKGDGQVAFAVKGDHLYLLGLNDWWNAGEGNPHSPVIGITANYYDTPSLRFTYRGDALGRLMPIRWWMPSHPEPPRHPPVPCRRLPVHLAAVNRHVLNVVELVVAAASAVKAVSFGGPGGHRHPHRRGLSGVLRPGGAARSAARARRLLRPPAMTGRAAARPAAREQTPGVTVGS